MNVYCLWLVGVDYINIALRRVVSSSGAESVQETNGVRKQLCQIKEADQIMKN